MHASYGRRRARDECRAPLADRLPVPARRRRRARVRAHGAARRERAGQDQLARSGRLGRADAVVPRRRRRDARARGRRRKPIVRAEVTTGERQQLFEAEIRVAGRNRILCNRQPVTRARDLHGLLRVTVFAPDDLALVKGGPAERRDVSRRAPRRCWRARYDAARVRLRTGAEAAQRVAARRRARRRGARHARRVRRPARARGARSSSRGRLRLARTAGAGDRGARTRCSRDDARPIGATLRERVGARRRSTAADADAVETGLRDALGAPPAGRDRPWAHARRPAPRRAGT